MKPSKTNIRATFLFSQADLQARIAEEQSRSEGGSGVLAHLDGLPGMVSPRNLLGELLTLTNLWRTLL